MPSREAGTGRCAAGLPQRDRRLEPHGLELRRRSTRLQAVARTFQRVAEVDLPAMLLEVPAAAVVVEAGAVVAVEVTTELVTRCKAGYPQGF